MTCFADTEQLVLLVCFVSSRLCLVACAKKDIFLGAEMLYPPHRRCIRSQCEGAKLGDAVRAACRIYMLHRGVLPAYEISIYCRSKYKV